MARTTLDANDKVSLVRLALGDLDSTNFLFSDDQITVVLGIQPIVTYAAAALAESAAALFARQASVSIGKTSVQNGQKFAFWKEMARNLRMAAGDLPGGDGTGVGTLSMSVGGLSKDARDNFHDDVDRIQPNFSVGMDDNPLAGGADRDPRRRGDF